MIRKLGFLLLVSIISLTLAISPSIADNDLEDNDDSDFASSYEF